LTRKIQAVKDWSISKTVTEIKRFIGLADIMEDLSRISLNFRPINEAHQKREKIYMDRRMHCCL